MPVAACTWLRLTENLSVQCDLDEYIAPLRRLHKEMTGVDLQASVFRHDAISTATVLGSIQVNMAVLEWTVLGAGKRRTAAMCASGNDMGGLPGLLYSRQSGGFPRFAAMTGLPDAVDAGGGAHQMLGVDRPTWTVFRQEKDAGDASEITFGLHVDEPNAPDRDQLRRRWLSLLKVLPTTSGGAAGNLFVDTRCEKHRILILDL